MVVLIVVAAMVAVGVKLEMVVVGVMVLGVMVEVAELVAGGADVKGFGFYWILIEFD